MPSSFPSAHVLSLSRFVRTRSQFIAWVDIRVCARIDGNPACSPKKKSWAKRKVHPSINLCHTGFSGSQGPDDGSCLWVALTQSGRYLSSLNVLSAYFEWALDLVPKWDTLTHSTRFGSRACLPVRRRGQGGVRESRRKEGQEKLMCGHDSTLGFVGFALLAGPKTPYPFNAND